MLTDLAYERKIGISLRGIRNATDFDYETTLFESEFGKQARINIQKELKDINGEY